MKTDTIFYHFFREFPRFFFELIGRREAPVDAYEFVAPEIKQRSFRLDGLFATLEGFEEEPLYFLEAQFYREEGFIARLFASIFLFFEQYNPPNPDWMAIVIYGRRSYEVEPPERYSALVERHLLRIYLDELEDDPEESFGVAIAKLIVERKNRFIPKAKELIGRAKRELPAAAVQQQMIEFIAAIVVCKFSKLSREEIEAMLELSELKQTKVYQEAHAEGRLEGLEQGIARGLKQGLKQGRKEGIEQGIEQGELNAKLNTIPLLQELGLSLEQIASRLELKLETVREAARKQYN